jgi:hypothetical protein
MAGQTDEILLALSDGMFNEQKEGIIMSKLHRWFRRVTRHSKSKNSQDNTDHFLPLCVFFEVMPVVL